MDTFITYAFNAGLFVIAAGAVVLALVDGGNKSNSGLMMFGGFGLLWISALYAFEAPRFRGVEYWYFAIAAFAAATCVYCLVRLVTAVVTAPRRQTARQFPQKVEG
jgi:ABC-type transport system involved in cytochrome c biogenesis permease subunit